MPKAHSSRKGSLAFRPRMRATRTNCRIRNWPSYGKPCLLGFAGYKAGMLHFIYNEDLATSPAKGKEVAMAGTVIEVPPMLVNGVRVLKRTPYGCKIIGDFCAKDANVLKKAGIKNAKTIDQLDGVKNEVCQVRVLALVNPAATGIGSKVPEHVELAVGGESIEKQLEYAKGLVGKEVGIEEAFAKGDYVDVIGVTKGKGWQGVIKRFG
ncbi:MAG: 50S ribosomal protein L3, partial [Candidatus Micrarchaeota archaeon]|nr:50S ribosomal protein L3 [Candidatus Micrarchaeota archaeon]